MQKLIHATIQSLSIECLPGPDTTLPCQSWLHLFSPEYLDETQKLKLAPIRMVMFAKQVASL